MKDVIKQARRAAALKSEGPKTSSYIHLYIIFYLFVYYIIFIYILYHIRWRAANHFDDSEEVFNEENGAQVQIRLHKDQPQLHRGRETGVNKLDELCYSYLYFCVDHHTEI